MNTPKTFVIATFAIAACGPALPSTVTLVPEVNHGPAAQAKPKNVLSLTSTCGALDARCTDEYRGVVDNIVRGSLEFAGYSITASESLRLATRQRTEEQTSVTTTATSSSKETALLHPLVFLPPLAAVESSASSASVTQTDTSFIVLTGSNFEDLSVDDRREVIEKSGTDAVLSVRIVIGGNVGVWEASQDIEVAVKLSVKKDDEMVWAARCKANSRDAATVEAALESATRCAMNGALAKSGG